MEAAAAPAVQKENRFWKGVLAVVGIMTTLVIYGVLQVLFSFFGLMIQPDPSLCFDFENLTMMILRRPHFCRR